MSNANQKNSARLSILSTAALLLAAAIWGLAFVAQSTGMDHIGPCPFNAIRSFLGALALLPVIAMLDYTAGEPLSFWGAAKTTSQRRQLLKGGIACGAALAIASLIQQYGIAYTTVGKAGFLTTLYIIFVPIAGIFLHRRPTILMGIAAVAAIAGMFLLCISGSTSFGKGDLAVLCCAFFFTAHIMVIDHFAPRVDCVRMSCLQFFVAGVISTVAAVIFQQPCTLTAALAAWKPLLFCGICSSGIAYTLQIVGQKHVHPTIATLVMSLESVFSAVGGWLILNQRMTPREITGCAIIFVAVLIAQIKTQES